MKYDLEVLKKKESLTKEEKESLISEIEILRHMAFKAKDVYTEKTAQKCADLEKKFLFHSQLTKKATEKALEIALYNKGLSNKQINYISELVLEVASVCYKDYANLIRREFKL